MRRNAYAAKVRSKILSNSLRLDYIITMMLGDLLGFAPVTSITLGTKSSTLSFKSKVELLIDIGALNKNNKNKFIKFMEIRNQFVHNISVDSFKSCFASVEGSTGFLKKNYPKAVGEKKTEESLFEKLYDELSEDVFNLAIGIGQKVKENERKSISAIYKNDAFDILVTSLDNLVKVHLLKSPKDSPEYNLARVVNSLVEGAKGSLAENIFKKNSRI